ncbi:MAG: 50S ribosomal protein L15 [Candidatus Nealsonbacteria bacterium]|nr:MAG: 50S ribosomal protein L15 [Candidatus Nealsonbacteria bacterium]
MQLHQLKPKHKLKKPKRVGRGGKRGTYSGRGLKGQRSRAGRKFKPAIRGLIKRYPKLRGYRFKSKVKSQKSKIAILNLEILEKRFNSEEKITPEILLERKIIRRIKGRLPKVKILSRGKLTKKLIIEGCQVSKSAKEEIEKAGGTIK